MRKEGPSWLLEITHMESPVKEFDAYLSDEISSFQHNEVLALWLPLGMFLPGLVVRAPRFQLHAALVTNNAVAPSYFQYIKKYLKLLFLCVTPRDLHLSKKIMIYEILNINH
jgi:hypothetical protein